MSEIGERDSGIESSARQSDDSALTPDDEGARYFRRHHASGVAIVSTVADGAYRASTLAAWFVASIQPMQVLLSLEAESQISDWIAEAGFFAISVLPWREQFLADQFAGYTPRALPGFAGIPHRPGETGAPIFDGSIAWAECTVSRQLETGDHICVLGNVVSLGLGTADVDDPLVYFLSRYRRFR